MTPTTTSTPAQTVASSIVAQDVAQGRPGKPATSLPQKPGCGWLLFLLIVGFFGTGAGLGLGYLLGGGNNTGTLRVGYPDTPIPLVPQPQDMTTVAANPTYNGPEFGVIQFTCNGIPRSYPVTGPLILGNGQFSLTPQQTSPFNGTLSPTFMVNATGDSGTLSGTLVSGNNQSLMLVTQDRFFPCVGGPFPFQFQIQSDLNLTPMVTKGPSLADQIAAAVLINNTRVCSQCGEPIFPWFLFGLLLATGVVSMAAYTLWWRHFKIRGYFDDDDDYHLYPHDLRPDLKVPFGPDFKK